MYIQDVFGQYSNEASDTFGNCILAPGPLRLKMASYLLKKVAVLFANDADRFNTKPSAALRVSVCVETVCRECGRIGLVGVNGQTKQMTCSLVGNLVILEVIDASQLYFCHIVFYGV